jgi:hypothetical protein
MDTKLPGSMQATISARVEHDPESLGLLISTLTKVWDTANVKTSCLDVIRDGRRLRLVTITFDAVTYEQYETMSSIRCSPGEGSTT